MIGNDVVDLGLTRIQSTWERKGFLDKIFTTQEQNLILASEKPERMVWNLWSRKEAAYKIFNRYTQLRVFNPLEFNCIFKNELEGTVIIRDSIFYTKTELNKDCIYTIAVSETIFFSKIQLLSLDQKYHKENNIPYWIDPITQQKKPVSITHHGRFWFGIYLEL